MLKPSESSNPPHHESDEETDTNRDEDEPEVKMKTSLPKKDKDVDKKVLYMTKQRHLQDKKTSLMSQYYQQLILKVRMTKRYSNFKEI